MIANASLLDALRPPPPPARASPPSVAELLDVDREYRDRAGSGSQALHTVRGEHRYTALYSQTPLARRIGRDRDWVILDLEIRGPNARWTVVTEFRGSLKGKRVVRGREVECFEFYRARRGGRRARHRPIGARRERW